MRDQLIREIWAAPAFQSKPGGAAAASIYDDMKDFFDPPVPERSDDPPDWADPEATSGGNNNGKNQ